VWPIVPDQNAANRTPQWVRLRWGAPQSVYDFVGHRLGVPPQITCSCPSFLPPCLVPFLFPIPFLFPSLSFRSFHTSVLPSYSPPPPFPCSCSFTTAPLPHLLSFPSLFIPHLLSVSSLFFTPHIQLLLSRTRNVFLTPSSASPPTSLSSPPAPVFLAPYLCNLAPTHFPPTAHST